MRRSAQHNELAEPVQLPTRPIRPLSPTPLFGRPSCISTLMFPSPCASSRRGELRSKARSPRRITSSLWGSAITTGSNKVPPRLGFAGLGDLTKPGVPPYATERDAPSPDHRTSEHGLTAAAASTLLGVDCPCLTGVRAAHVHTHADERGRATNFVTERVEAGSAVGAVYDLVPGISAFADYSQSFPASLSSTPSRQPARGGVATQAASSSCCLRLHRTLAVPSPSTRRTS